MYLYQNMKNAMLISAYEITGINWYEIWIKVKNLHLIFI